jgi:hypothetical protein
MENDFESRVNQSRHKHHGLKNNRVSQFLARFGFQFSSLSVFSKKTENQFHRHRRNETLCFTVKPEAETKHGDWMLVDKPGERGASIAAIETNLEGKQLREAVCFRATWFRRNQNPAAVLSGEIVIVLISSTSFLTDKRDKPLFRECSDRIFSFSQNSFRAILESYRRNNRSARKEINFLFVLLF